MTQRDEAPADGGDLPRATEEDARRSAELERASAEDARRDAEEARRIAETARKIVEEARVTAEKARDETLSLAAQHGQQAAVISEIRESLRKLRQSTKNDERYG